MSFLDNLTPAQTALIIFLPELVLLFGGLIFMIAAITDRHPEDQPRLKLAALMMAAGLMFNGFVQFAFLVKHGAPGLSLPDALNADLHFISVTQDGFAICFKLVIFIGLFLTILLTCKDQDLADKPVAEYYSLLFFSVLGMCFMAAGRDLLTLWVGLETMALATYALVALPRHDRRAPEGAMKYFILGTLSSGLFLYGASLLYGATGSYQLDEMSRILDAIYASGVGSAAHSLAGLGVVILLIALLFKVGAVPFHMWLPDAYTGAPTAITAFMSVAVKTASFAMILRILYEGLGPAAAVWTPLVAGAAAITMIWGNAAAVLQTNVKRLLAYSSIAHAGYVLVGIVAFKGTDGASGETAVWYYLLAYTFMNMAAFGLLIWLREDGVSGEAFEDFAGLHERAPVLAALITIVMLALTGIPLTAGFTAKFAVFGAAIHAGHIPLAAIGLLASAISLYYYFRIVVQIYMKPADGRPAPALSLPVVTVVGLGTLATLLMGFGVGMNSGRHAAIRPATDYDTAPSHQIVLSPAAPAASNPETVLPVGVSPE